MRIWILISCVWIGLTACHAQSTTPATASAQAGEFGLTTNGLLYSPRTMSRLQRIVDSLNLRHKVCDLSRVYQSKWQGQATYVRLEQGDLAAAAKLLKSGTTVENFLRQYPGAKQELGLLVVATHEQDEYGDKPHLSTEYRSIPLNGRGDYTLSADGHASASALASEKWIVEYEKRGYPKPYVEAFYFPEGLACKPLAKSYAMLVQYADCLVDTTAQIYLQTAKRTGVRMPQKATASQAALLEFVHQQTNYPSDEYKNKTGQEELRAQWLAYREWDSLRIPKVDALAKTPRFRELLVKAATDDATLGNTSDEFEEYVARYYSPARALLLKRSRRVVGSCSMDDSPRRHALGIAQLSAEAVNWETFLRAHLDIMNDRFERDSDGSYAWEKRQTYLRELEELDINVPDLLLGISLRIDNPSNNHYFGTVNRVGRALAETQQPREIEQRLLSTVADPTLDTFNRLLAYYLFLNYNQHLPDKAQQRNNILALNESVRNLPSYLVAHATVQAKK
ncbi:hypothetical protein [Hymenobacter wooponensis]|uniref:Uncharacterized protein n=1 Tax=Hymenobacter wooponensis TaxID=1525360 RepID=A0A4Z0MKS4_9BACT|nr:hypothetical protein [Hymenobacter wooponensis]TGD79918.1 hypothetical protein EU557_17060 [Hymenobacter wooponensis]